MKVRAHLMVAKGYALAIMASQWPEGLEQRCEEHNQQRYAPGDDDEPGHDSNYLAYDRDRTVVTVEFELPDSVFRRQDRTVLAGDVMSPSPRGGQTP